MKVLITGNEAVARGAFEAGVTYASAYPGTPSTEILENMIEYKEDLIAEWAPNEKVALEVGIGVAFAREDEGALDLIGGLVAFGHLGAVADSAHFDLADRGSLAGMDVLGAQNDI